MQKDLNIKKIQSKFQELINLDENRQETLDRSNNSRAISMISGDSNSSFEKSEQSKIKVKEKKKASNGADEFIFTKSDICKQVSKLKPYLQNLKQMQTSVELEDKENKKIEDEQRNSLSELIICLNKQLCERIKGIEQDESQQMKRQNRQKQGWVYEVFYRFCQSQSAGELSQTVFKNGYAVLTEVLQLFPNLTFSESLIKININEIKRVKYIEEREYQIIDIRFNDMALHFGFLNEIQIKLFDRMLFLLKNMARTSSTRLFQNQLLKNIYSQY